MPKQFIELMFGEYRRRLLATLLLRPGAQFHTRELARMTGIAAGSVHRELKALSEAGLLLRKHIGNQVFYQANLDCPVYSELAGIFRKTTGLSEILKDAFSAIASEIEFALVFGSMASGKANPDSDLDILVLADLQLIEVVKATAPLHSELGREVNPVVMTVRKFLDLLAKKDRFACRVTEEPKMLFIGTEDDFEKLAGNRSTRGARD